MRSFARRAWLVITRVVFTSSAVAVVMICILGLASAALAAEETIPDREVLLAPTAARLDAICAAAQREGWESQTASLRSAARRAFAKDKLPAAAGWLRVFRWSALLSRNEAEFVPGWIKTVQAAGVAHDGMAAKYLARPVTLSASLPSECQVWMIHHAEFSDEFFSLLQPVDYAPKVLEILGNLYRHDRARFEMYGSLALAIAVVYDVPPPSDWPHAQVTSAVLPRRWRDPLEVFDWFTTQDRLGLTYHSIARLHADELKFVVDITASSEELEWAQTSVKIPLAQFEQMYARVSYRKERMSDNKMVWSEKDYQLRTILATGGICVDQAYFATQVGKARGVPTLFFHGAGNDGRHAWFGFLDRNQQWQLDAGRYAEQSFVTGLARDPQTWRTISDHELLFLSERFRSSPSFQESRILAEFASDLLAMHDAAAAVKAARRAVLYERRNAPAWGVLLTAESAAGVSAKESEGTMREAIIALSHYPDLEMLFSKRLSESLRSRGETSAADFEQRRLARKYELGRVDLNLSQARDALWQTRVAQTPEQLVSRYNATLDRLGPGEGIAFFDEIVAPLVEYLVEHHQVAAARGVVARAQRTLRVVPGSQLEREFTTTSEQLKTKQ